MTGSIDCHAGKAEVLDALRPHLSAARIPVGIRLSWSDWSTRPGAGVSDALLLPGRGPLAVRSARTGEDASVRSAGMYCSRLDVPRDPRALACAVQEVFASYGTCVSTDAVLIQPQVRRVRHALAASSRGAFGSGYHLVSSARGARPDAITRGDCAADTWHVRPGARTGTLPPHVQRALAVLESVCRLMPDQPLELELVDDGTDAWLLQARPLPGSPVDAAPQAVMPRARRQVRRARATGAVLLGLMPDWNPAELLGAHPRPLSLSVFASVIGDGTWWRSRASLGYARPYRAQLLRPIAGRPYVDVRASFESLCPAAVDPRLRQRVVRDWLQALGDAPQLHDRVEFDVAVAAPEFDARQRLAMIASSVDRSAWLDALRRIAVDALDPLRLASRRRLFGQQLCASVQQRSPSARLKWLRDRVAAPFAQAARCDFIAQALWRSAVRRGAIAPERCLAMLSAVPTDTGLDAPLALRPRQFDLGGMVALPSPGASSPAVEFRLAADEHAALARLLREQRLPWSPIELVELSRLAAIGRQLGKQVLAALLGGWFDALASDCAARGVGDDILPWLEWRHAANPQLPANSLIARAAAARQRYAQDGHLRMPPLIACEDDLLLVPQPAASGHFHGSGCIEGALVQVGPASRPHDVPLRAVLAIESADPGYEWIFSREPVALVTAFGGPHSHMALRCAGAGCGAVLGVGIARFERLLAAPRVRVDFAAGSIEARATEQVPRQQVA